MATKKRSSCAPKGWHTVTPRIVAKRARELVEFIRRVLGASGEYHDDRPAELKVGDSVVMISEAGARKPMRAFLYVYVEDADETYRRAVEAGARSLEEPTEMPYGDRRCMLEDRWGNTWQIATYRARRTAHPRSRKSSPRRK